jgi:hypothetical protein
MKGQFNWNITLITPLETKAIIYIATNTRTTFAPNCDEAFATGMAPQHYSILEFCTPVTRG